MKKIVVALCFLIAACASFKDVEWSFDTDEEVNAWIKAGANVNARDSFEKTPLMHAASFNENPAVIEALIKAGAKVNAKNDFGKTALMYAAWFNRNPAVIEALIKAGADVKVRDKKGKTAFDYAEENPNIKDTPVY